ncbi:MAG: hypothetical protein AB7R87_03365 [Parvibaculaceae bacterium]
MTARPKPSTSGARRPSPCLNSGEFRKDADKTSRRETEAPSLSEVDWADLSPEQREKRQRA